MRVTRGCPKIPREQRCESLLTCAEARGGRIPSAVSDRRATKEQVKRAATPLGPGSFWRGAASLARHVAQWLCSSLGSLPQAKNPPGAATGNFRTASRTPIKNRHGSRREGFILVPKLHWGTRLLRRLHYRCQSDNIDWSQREMEFCGNKKRSQVQLGNEEIEGTHDYF